VAYYLVVLESGSSTDNGGRPLLRALIATLLWSPTTESRQFSLRHGLPEAMSEVGAPHTIGLG
jgi:hypothetical protein